MNDVDIIKLLLKFKADPNKLTASSDTVTSYIFSYAFYNQHKEDIYVKIITLLLLYTNNNLNFGMLDTHEKRLLMNTSLYLRALDNYKKIKRFIEVAKLSKHQPNTPRLPFEIIEKILDYDFGSKTKKFKRSRSRNRTKRSRTRAKTL